MNKNLDLAQQKLKSATILMHDRPSDETYLDFLAASQHFGEMLVEDLKEREEQAKKNYPAYVRLVCSLCGEFNGAITAKERFALIYSDVLCSKCFLSKVPNPATRQ